MTFTELLASLLTSELEQPVFVKVSGGRCEGSFTVKGKSVYAPKFKAPDKELKGKEAISEMLRLSNLCVSYTAEVIPTDKVPQGEEIKLEEIQMFAEESAHEASVLLRESCDMLKKFRQKGYDFEIDIVNLNSKQKRELTETVRKLCLLTNELFYSVVGGSVKFCVLETKGGFLFFHLIGGDFIIILKTSDKKNITPALIRTIISSAEKSKESD